MSISGPDPEWSETMERFKDGINVADTSKDELGDYIETRIYTYTRDNFTDYSL